MLSEREKMIGNRLRAFREMLQIPRAKFAASIGYGSERIAAYEAGRARLPYHVFKAVSRRYDLYPGWLNAGTAIPQIKNSFDDTAFTDKISRNALFTEVFDVHLSSQLRESAKRLKEKAAVIGVVADELSAIILDESEPEDFRSRLRKRFAGKIRELHETLEMEKRMGYFADLALEKVLDKKKELTNYPQEGNLLEMKPAMPKLIERLKKATEERGRKTELASWLSVTPQKVTDWLSGRVEPSGETTLRLLHWVEQQERKI